MTNSGLVEPVIFLTKFNYIISYMYRHVVVNNAFIFTYVYYENIFVTKNEFKNIFQSNI
jgi:hypothetical protein